MNNDRFGRGRNRDGGRRRGGRTGRDAGAPRAESAVHSRAAAQGLRLDGPLIIGRNSVQEVLRRKPHSLLRVYLTEAAQAAASQIAALVAEQRVPCEVRHAAELSAAAGSDSHQGVVGVLKNRHHPEIGEFLEGALQQPRALIIMADSIYDPHNLGAILRACECFGLYGVVLSKNRGTGITPSVTKSSVGASELVPVCMVSNLAQALHRALDLGFAAVAADVGVDSTELPRFEFGSHVVLVLGSEGEGIQPLLRKLCGAAVTVPMSGAIDSLNVSQAAAVFAYAWSSQSR
ncbi:MAG: 23S rRNA (guanosine(2251)-2'-O)-methyltransferase RlmB [Proteobacteria bacterium]|nr:23S rRNA (guanosine(2251)-2'-O)-methyltransferase RlmB [Pseudomonadota bacterium]